MPTVATEPARGSIPGLCRLLAPATIAKAAPEGGQWVALSDLQSATAHLRDFGVSHAAQCAWAPPDDVGDYPNHYVTVSQAQTAEQVTALERDARTYVDHPAVAGIGDQAYRNRGAGGLIDFRVGANWFEVNARLPLPGGQDDFDSEASTTLALAVAPGLAASIAKSRVEPPSAVPTSAATASAPAGGLVAASGVLQDDFVQTPTAAGYSGECLWILYRGQHLQIVGDYEVSYDEDDPTNLTFGAAGPVKAAFTATTGTTKVSVSGTLGPARVAGEGLVCGARTIRAIELSQI